MKNASFVSRIFKNIQYKIAAIILATLAWYIVQGEEVLELDRAIQVNIVIPEGYMIKGSPTRIKDATIKGQRVLLGEISTSNRPLEAKVFIPKGKTGRIRILLSKQHIINWNKRLNIKIHDPYITVVIDEKATRTLPVRENFTGVVADGYMIEKTIIKPKNITITGLKSEISKLKDISTEPIDVAGLQQTKSFEARLLSPRMSQSDLSAEKVSVSIQIGEQKINRRFGAIPIEIEGSDYKSTVNPKYISIVVQGTPGVLSFIKHKDLRAFLDARNLQPGRYEQKIQVKIPKDTVLIETLPENASVTILKQKTRK